MGNIDTDPVRALPSEIGFLMAMDNYRRTISGEPTLNPTDIGAIWQSRFENPEVFVSRERIQGMYVGYIAIVPNVDSEQREIELYVHPHHDSEEAGVRAKLLAKAEVFLGSIVNIEPVHQTPPEELLEAV